MKEPTAPTTPPDFRTDLESGSGGKMLVVENAEAVVEATPTAISVEPVPTEPPRILPTSSTSPVPSSSSIIINPLHISQGPPSNTIIRDSDDDSDKNKNPSNVTSSWIFGLRAAYCIFAIICLVQGIEAWMLNCTSGDKAAIGSAFGGFSGCLLALWFTLSRQFRYNGYLTMTCVIIITGIIAISCAGASYASLSTLIACANGNNFYGDSSYYQSTMECVSQDPWATDNCNCVNTVDSNCIVHADMAQHCDMMLNDSPGLASDVLAYAIIQLIFSMILSLTFCITVTEPDVDFAWYVWNGGVKNKPNHHHGNDYYLPGPNLHDGYGGNNVNVDVFVFDTTSSPLHSHSNYGDAHHHSHTGGSAPPTIFHHGHSGGFHHHVGGLADHHGGGDCLGEVCHCICHCLGDCLGNILKGDINL